MNSIVRVSAEQGSVASAVNHVNIENQATGGGPIVSAAGDDTNVDIVIQGKGSGEIDATNSPLKVAHPYVPILTLTDGATINWNATESH